MRTPVVAALLAILVACAHAKEAPVEAAGPLPVTSEVIGDELLRTFDLNRDGKADDWKTYKLIPDVSKNDAPPREVLLKRELDTNFDGKPDLITTYADDGTKLREELDLDFDGKTDVVDVYEKGVLIRRESWTRHAEKPDSIAYYEGGKKVRVERDTRGAGKVDTWEYYENGKLSRVGEDVDGDGLVDRWIKSKDQDDGDAAPKSARK